MILKKLIVHLQEGLQARNATQFVQKASSFNSDIKINKNGRSVEGKSIMGVMAIAIRNKEEITLTIHGTDEQEALVSLRDFLQSEK